MSRSGWPNTWLLSGRMLFVWVSGVLLVVVVFVGGWFAFRFHLMGWLLRSHMSNDLLVAPMLSVQVQN